MEHLQTELRESHEKIYNSYNWFKWIALLSLVNSVLMIMNSNITFIFGLAANIYLYVIGYELFGKFSVITIICQLILPAIYFLLYKMNKSMKKWPIIVGVVLYGMDAILYLLSDDLLSIAFHIYVMYSILKSFWEIDKYKEKLAQIEVENRKIQMEEVSTVEESN